LHLVGLLHIIYVVDFFVC